VNFVLILIWLFRGGMKISYEGGYFSFDNEDEMGNQSGLRKKREGLGHSHFTSG